MLFTVPATGSGTSARDHGLPRNSHFDDQVRQMPP